MPLEPSQPQRAFDRSKTSRSNQSAVATSASVHWRTVALTSSSLIVGVTAIGADLEPRWQVFVWLAVGVVSTIVAGRVGAKTATTRVDSLAPIFIFGSYVASLAVEPFIRWAGSGRPLELMLSEGLLATLPVFAFAAAARRWVALAGTASLFAVLIAVCLLSSPIVALLAAAWVVIGVMWLLAVARSGLAGEVIVERKIDRRWYVPVVVFLLAGVVATFSAGRDSLSLANGWLSSSGGDGESSEFARDGVGDGDALVAATTQAESFGPIEDAPFARSDEPSLYDLFDDSYGEPLKIKKNDRSVSLSPEDVIEGENEMAEAEAAGREFSTLRRPRTDLRGGVDDLSSTAMFYLAGRVPLHLRMQVFQDFDGVSWHKAKPRKEHTPEVVFEIHNDKPWLLVPQPQSVFHELLAAPEAHALKPVHFDDTRIPTPPNATGIHIHQVDKDHLFEWVQEDIIGMTRKRLPKLVPIHIMSRRIDEDLIDDTLVSVGAGPHTLHHLPSNAETSRIRELAQEWAAGTESGWSQIQRVLERLKQHCVLDPDATVSPDSEFPVGDFLFRTKRGPDYQFATAGCLLLRSLGYSTRLVAGFYADAEKYDSIGRHTPVDGGDVHTWCEVRLGGKCWATVEPTPGYTVLAPPRSLWYRMTVAVQHAVLAALNAWPLLVGLTLLGLLMLWRRADLSDAAATIYLAATGRTDDPVVVWRLVEQRLDRVVPAPPGRTPRHRVEDLSIPAELKVDLKSLIEQAEAGVFATLRPGTKGDGKRHWETLKHVSLRRLRQWKLDAPKGTAA